METLTNVFYNLQNNDLSNNTDYAMIEAVRELMTNYYPIMCKLEVRATFFSFDCLIRLN